MLTCRFALNLSNDLVMAMMKNETNQTTDNVRYLSKDESSLVVVLYTMISFIAIVGNSVVLYIIGHFRRMRTPTNLLIANLAIADLMMAVLCVPFSYWPTLILQCWPFGNVLCKLINFMQAVAVFLSSYTLVAISFDRFLAIMFPMRPDMRLTTSRSIIVIAFVWLVSIFIAAPLLVVLEVFQYPDSLQCQENWKDNLPFIGQTGYSMSLLILQYFFPLLVLIVTYAGIGARIWFTKMPGVEESKSRKEASAKERRDAVRKMIPMMLLVTLLYALCWLPQNVLMNIIVPAYPDILMYRYILYIWWMVHMTAMSHSLVNPIIYCTRNDRFREGFMFAFRWLPCINFRNGVHLNPGTIREFNMTETVRYANSVAYRALPTKNNHVQKTLSDQNGDFDTKA